jgi:hypothetical protein
MRKGVSLVSHAEQATLRVWPYKSFTDTDGVILTLAKTFDKFNLLK